MICPNLYMQPKKDHILTGPYSKFWCLVKWQIKKPVGKGHVAYLIGIINCIVWGYSNNAKRKKIKYFWFITKADDVFPHSSVGKESACSAGDLRSIPGWEDPLEKEMATHSSTLAWRIPWIEEPDRLQSMGSQESDMT